MPIDDKTRPASPRAKLEQAISLAKGGHKTEACEILRNIVAAQPVNQAAWLWLSAVTAEQAEAAAALAQAKRINPAHPSLLRAEQWLVHRFSTASATKKSRAAKPPPVSPPVPKTFKNLFGIFNSLAFGAAVLVLLGGLLILFLGLIFEVRAAAHLDESQNLAQDNPDIAFEKVGSDSDYRPELDAARAEQNWTGAITILEEVYRLEPNSQSIKEQLANAYLQNGVTLRSRGFVEEALANFEEALKVKPEDTYAGQEVELASAYLAGVGYYQAGQWQAAVTELERVLARDNSYVNTKDLLYSAYYNLGLARQAAGELPQARDALEAAINLRPDLSVPRRLMAEVEFAMAPQTPLVTPETVTPIEDRIIVVGIAEQRMVVYEGDKQVFDFVVSTGEPGRETAIGEFEVLNKIDVAYASTWNLDMPYWMGIYWAGSLQNGIHALPIVKHTGYKLWDGYLGQRVSYGCVILSDEDAASLYNWAEVGTRVKIVSSLADWLQEE